MLKFKHTPKCFIEVGISYFKTLYDKKRPEYIPSCDIWCFPEIPRYWNHMTMSKSRGFCSLFLALVVAEKNPENVHPTSSKATKQTERVSNVMFLKNH